MGGRAIRKKVMCVDAGEERANGTVEKRPRKVTKMLKSLNKYLK